MATHIEMKRTAEDAAAVRSMARYLLALDGHEWTDWELDFLEHMAAHIGPDPISTRQREVLFELRDRSVLAADWRGIPVPRLIARCFEARLDLDEDDEAFVASLDEQRPTALRRGQLFRLVRVAVRLGLVEPHFAPPNRQHCEAA